MARNFGLKSDGTLGFLNKGLFDGIDVAPERLPSPVEYTDYCFPLLTDNADKPQLIKVDWLRASIRGQDSTAFVPQDLEDILLYDQTSGSASTDLVIRSSTQNVLGYPHVKKIFFYANNELTACGAIAYNDDLSSSNCGCLFDASGTLCSYLQQNCPIVWLNLVQYLAGYNFRITRVDLALDVDGVYCRREGITVPRMLQLGKYKNYFSSSNSRNGQALTTNQFGDWSDLSVGDVMVKDYDPAIHAPLGLTATFGARTSPNYFRVYEKGKQLLGMADEPDLSVDRSWVRFEQEIKRDKDGAAIPFEALLEPDAWFCIGRENLRNLLADYSAYLGKNTVIAAQRAVFARKERNLSVKRKIHWARRSYGRLFRTLISEGIDPQGVVDSVLRETGLKNFIYDIAEDETIDFTDSRVESMAVAFGMFPQTSDKAKQVRSAHGLWSGR
jgi:DNA relaxase NicK